LICEAVAATPARSVIIDGEAAYCDAAGVPVFDKLHSRAYDDHLTLTLRRANVSRSSGTWQHDDLDVFDGERERWKAGNCQPG
jgi:hypothetical protein